MDEKNNDAKIDAALRQAIEQSVGGESVNPEEPSFAKATEDAAAEKFRRGYSWAAAVFGPVYFWAMGDWLFTILSVLFALTLFPLLLILPFWARNRVWKSHQWGGPIPFIKAQEFWDKMALYFLIFSVIIIVLLFKFVAMPFLNSLMSNTSVTNLNDTVKSYRELLQFKGRRGGVYYFATSSNFSL